MQHEGVERFKHIIEQALADVDPMHFASLIGTTGDHETVKAHGEAAVNQMKLHLDAFELPAKLWRMAVDLLMPLGGAEIKIPAAFLQFGPVKPDKRIPIALDAVRTGKMLEALGNIDTEAGVTILAHAENLLPGVGDDGAAPEETQAQETDEKSTDEPQLEIEEPTAETMDYVTREWWTDPGYVLGFNRKNEAAFEMGFKAGTMGLPERACPAFADFDEKTAETLKVEWERGIDHYNDNFADGSWSTSKECPSDRREMGYDAGMKGLDSSENPWAESKDDGSDSAHEAYICNEWAIGHGRAMFEQDHAEYPWCGSKSITPHLSDSDAVILEQALIAGFMTAAYVNSETGEAPETTGDVLNPFGGDSFNHLLYSAFMGGVARFIDTNTTDRPWFVNADTPVPREAGRHAAVNNRDRDANPYKIESSGEFVGKDSLEITQKLWDLWDDGFSEQAGAGDSETEPSETEPSEAVAEDDSLADLSLPGAEESTEEEPEPVAAGTDPEETDSKALF